MSRFGDIRVRRARATKNVPGSMRRLLAAGISLCVPLAGLAAPTPPPGPQVQARLLVPESAAAGEKLTIVLEMTLGPGWHVNGHRPRQSFLIPTSVAITASSGTPLEVRYPEAVTKRFDFSDEPLAVYEGTVRFASDLAVPPIARGHVEVSAVLTYQPCNETQCYPPAKKPLSATVAVIGSPAKGRQP